MLGTLEQIQSCHSEAHSLLFGTDMINKRGILGQVSAIFRHLLYRIIKYYFFITSCFYLGSKYRRYFEQVDSFALWWLWS